MFSSGMVMFLTFIRINREQFLVLSNQLTVGLRKLNSEYNESLRIEGYFLLILD